MALPTQVVEAGKAADEALSAINTPPTEEKPDNKPAEIDADTVEGLKAQTAELTGKLEKSEHKYSVLQGKYNHEIQAIKDDVNLLNNLKSDVKRLEKSNSEFQRKVAELVTQNAEFVRQKQDLEIQLANKNKEAPPQGDTEDVTQLLSEEDRQTLEDEGITGQAQDIITKLVRKLTPLKTAEETTSKEADQTTKSDNESVVDSFWSGLEDAVEDWQPVNRSPEFNDWLDEPAPYSDKTRRQILTEAQEKLDLKTVIAIFSDFKATDSYNPPETAPEEKPSEKPPEKPEKAPESNLENELEPDRPQNVDVVINPATEDRYQKMLNPKYVFPRAEITAFYKDATQSGSLSETNRELYDKIDKAIVKAGAEGRVA
ncbi:MAG: hypothetical protein ACYSU6_01335 [Planctomycetota bacterium]|jgi:hypothetical protein